VRRLQGATSTDNIRGRLGSLLLPKSTQDHWKPPRMTWARFRCQRKEHLCMKDEQKPKSANDTAHNNRARVGAEDAAWKQPLDRSSQNKCRHLEGEGARSIPRRVWQSPLTQAKLLNTPWPGPVSLRVEDALSDEIISLESRKVNHMG
jgi:hypothetical protein